MTEQAGPQSIEDALAIFETPDDQLPPLPPLPFAARLYANPQAHRVVPDRLAFRLTDLRSDIAFRRNAGLRADAVKAMRYLLGKSERAHEAEALAKAYARETARRSEFLWRPWMAKELRVENPEVAHDLVREGRGLIFNFMHHGPYVALTQAMEGIGLKPYAAIAPFYFEEPFPGYRGHRDRRHMLTLRAGGHVFNAAGSLPLLTAILQDNRPGGLSTDVPGSAEMTFLGRRVRAASGCTKLSLRTDTPILPLAMRRAKDSWGVVRILDPIDPRDFPEVDALQQEIANRFEPGVLEWPEALEWPLERWTPADPADCEEFGFPPPS